MSAAYEHTQLNSRAWIPYPPRRELPVEQGIRDLLLAEIVDKSSLFRVTRGMKLFEDDDACVLRFDMPCVGPEMPCVMEQHEICPVIGKDDPTAICRIEQLAAVGRSQAPFVACRKNHMSVCAECVVQCERYISST